MSLFYHLPTEPEWAERRNMKHYLDNKDKVIVSDQWTKEKMPEFIKNASGLGYTIIPL